MDIKKLQEPLPINNVEFRVQSIIESNWKTYAIILAYKDARVDMQRLDDVVWPLNWKREHTRENKNCIVSIWNEETKQWISKEDTWTESNTEQEKWLASDSFKRACFNRGIGRELYNYPSIFIEMESWEYFETQWKKKANSKFLKWWKREGVVSIDTVMHLEVKDKAWKIRFTFWKKQW